MVFYYSGDFLFPKNLTDEIKQNFAADIEICEITSDEDIEQVKDAVIFVGWPTDEMLKAMKDLRWLQLPSAGANHFFDHPLINPNVIVTNSSGVFGVAGGEHALALMLFFARQLHIHIDQKNKRIWKRNPEAISIQNSTVAVIGLGDIGSEVAKRAKDLGARVIAVKRHLTSKPSFVDELYPVDQLEEILSESDYVVNALPLTEETYHFFTRERIAKMKKGVFFINVGRGQTVDEEALITFLKSGHIGGAGLDVAEVEPLPEDSVLWVLPNVLLTSHSVGVAPYKQENRVKLIQKNLKKFLNGETLINVVDRKLGY